jgi:hypothetical protein
MDDKMTEQDYQLLSRFIDGELDGGDAQALRKRLLAEPALRSELDRMRAVNERVKSAFEVPGADRVPASVEALLEPAGRSGVPNHHTWGMAVAAALIAAAGLLLAPQWQQLTNGDLSGDAQLAAVLEQSPSRAGGWDKLADGRQVRPVLSFSNQDGNWCREYLLTAQGSSFRGVACRTAGQWHTEVLSSAELAGSSNEYRPAGAADADQVTDYIATQGASIPLSLDDEAALIDSQWQ